MFEDFDKQVSIWTESFSQAFSRCKAVGTTVKGLSPLVRIVSLCVLLLLLLIIITFLYLPQQSRQFASTARTTAMLGAETVTFASPVSRATASAGNYIQFNRPINTSTGTVFEGVNVDMCLINPNSPDYVKNAQGQDLIDTAYHLGINFFRIIDLGCTKGGSDGGGAGAANNWALVLNKMAQYGIQAMPLAGAHAPMSGSTLTSATQSYIVSYVRSNRLGNYSNVYGIDMINEPTLNTNNLSILQQTAQQIKTAYPNLRLTVGGWKVANDTYGCVTQGSSCYEQPQDGRLLANIVDFYSPHLYGYDEPMNGPYPDPYTFTTNYFDAMLSYTVGKPILIGEYGAGNGDGITDQGTLGSHELQANVTDALLRAVRAYQNKNVIGSAQWAFYNGSYTLGDTTGWDLVYNNGNTILPAASVIQKYRLGTSDAPVNPPLPITETDYIFQNADAGKTLSVHQNDILGFRLRLSTANTYTFSISDPTLFTQTEPFFYQPSSHFYVAVLHASNPRTATITVTQTNNCTTSCRVFQLTVNIGPALAPTPAPRVITQANVLSDASFDNPTTSPWFFSVSGSASATFTQDNTTHADGASSAKVAITTNSSNPKDIQLWQRNLTFTSNTIYPISFWAKDSAASTTTSQSVTMLLQEYGGSYITYCQDRFQITSTSWQLYTTSCTLGNVVATHSSFFAFYLGETTGTIWIDDVIVGNAAATPPSPPSCPNMPPAGAGIATGTITLPSAGNYYLWSRLASPDTTTHAFYVQINGVNNDCPIKLRTNQIAWTWINTDSDNTPILLNNLLADSYTINLIGGDVGTKVDRLLFTRDAARQPTSTCNNCVQPPTTMLASSLLPTKAYMPTGIPTNASASSTETGNSDGKPRRVFA